jgi:ribosome biogenesis protein UTP30
MAEVPEHYSVRPIQIQLPVPIYSEKYNSRFAVFTSDPESDFTAKIQDLNLPLMSEAIGYDRAKKHYRDNREKLKLLNANDLFFCDWKIYNLLRKHLGKLFYEKKRYPFPIDCEGVPEAQKDKFENYEQYLNSLANSTYTMLGNGPV